LEKIVKKVIKEQSAIGAPNFGMYQMPDFMNRGNRNGVESVQRALIKKGYDVGPSGADGDMGPNTKRAILKYQKDNGIKQTGNVGPITSKRLGVQQLTSGKSKIQTRPEIKPKTQTRAEINPELKKLGFTIDYDSFNKDVGYFVTKCKQKQCSEFTGDMLNKTFGDAWHAKENLGVKVNVDTNTVKKMETLFNKMNNSGIIPSLEQKTPFDNEAKEIVKKLIPDQSKFQNLPIGTVVGLYFPPSSNYDLAFFQGAIGKTRTGKGELKSIISHPYFCKNLNDCKDTVWTEKDLGRKNKFVAGNTLKSGESFAPVTHLGFIGYKDKNGVPYIVHNIKHDVYAFPTNKLNSDGLQIIWAA